MENDFIDWLKVALDEQTDTNPGIGDDAAVLFPPTEMKQLITSDCLVDQIHFNVSTTPLDLIGHKCVAASISDIAAMCGVPSHVVISIVAPKHFSLEDLKTLYGGMISVSKSYSCSIVGGDFISHTGPLMVSVTVLGQARPKQLRFRFGTEPNDRIFVSGSLGGSQRGHHLTFLPRIELGVSLGNDPTVHSVTDITDGLVIDLYSILASANYGATLISENIPTSSHLGKDRTSIESALYDGEDFELLFTASAQYVGHLNGVGNGISITEIGYVTQNAEFLLLEDSGELKSLEIRGYSH